MPSCRITNYTTQPLNVSLKHLCALHFENEVAPGQTVKLKPGRVWFTLEVLVDDERNRYSVAQSAAAIAIVSLACVGTAALAVPAAAAAGSAGVGSAIVAGAGQVGSAIATGAGTIGAAVTTVGPTITGAGVAGVWAVGDTIVSGVGTVVGAAQGFLTAHAATVSKISAAFLPRAIDLVEKEVGGFNAVQKEVVAILSSPTVTEDVRKSGLSILSRLGAALAADRAAEAEAKEKEEKFNEKENQDPASLPSQPKDASSSRRPSLKHLPSSVSTLLHTLSNEGREERKSTKVAAKEAKLARKDASSWEDVSIEEDVAAGKVLSSASAPEHKRVCVHGLFMNERRHFEVREREGKIVLVDANTGAVVVA
ncbi:hypothetical protein M408DRAFT_214343 [Serendipita vermifera MAFF 305830]|uniref:Uncharacterized protein n=1 Tax=Serendipita vermifera MAFF 305830 TaxID=933852 RepID=A0A0C3BJ85_SERVB|nr:hypothetical protein M408DRAFT_214343 [Serendipita vermifera MAFF 305830]